MCIELILMLSTISKLIERDTTWRLVMISMEKKIWKLMKVMFRIRLSRKNTNFSQMNKSENSRHSQKILRYMRS